MTITKGTQFAISTAALGMCGYFEALQDINLDFAFEFGASGNPAFFEEVVKDYLDHGLLKRVDQKVLYIDHNGLRLVDLVNYSSLYAKHTGV